MAAIQGAVDAGLYSALAAGTALTAACGSHIYEGAAPAGVTGDVVIFRWTGGGPEPLRQVRDVEVQYLVEYVSDSQPRALSGAGLIDDVLDGAALTVSGWNVDVCENAGLFSLDEPATGGQWYYRRGAYYRIVMDEGT